jgi:VWFA-related protein
MLALVLSAVLTAQLQETITVRRVLVDVRVTEFGGEPIADLTAADFDVRVGGKRAVVESAEWIDDLAVESSSRQVDEERPLEGSKTRRLEDSTTRPGRLLVLFVQTDFTREPSRVSGQMKFLNYAEEIIDDLQPEDRMAVFSFDSHLKFRLDFSNDKEALRVAARNTLWIDHPPPPPAVPAPSLAPGLDPETMRRAWHSETAIELVANALAPIPGPKSMILLGWGLGELTPIGVKMKVEWKPARLALDKARVSIFALDTTYADYHDLEFGLQSAAEETGGFYAKTHIFPRVALQRLQRTLSGHYELTLRAPGELKIGSRPLDVRVKRRGARVLAPQSVIIRN